MASTEDATAAGPHLGLWLVARLARLHGGELEVTDGWDGRGARMVVRLPARDR